MKTFRVIHLSRVLLGMAVAIWLTGAARGQSAARVVEAQAVVATDAVRAGSTSRLAVVAQVAPGYHINDHKPTLDYLIPTEVKFEGTKELSIEKLLYPKGELKQFAFSETRLSVYEGRLIVGGRLRVARGTPPGTYTLKGKFAYQACNDHACLPPTSVPLALTVKIVAPGAPVKRVHEDVFRNVKWE